MFKRKKKQENPTVSMVVVASGSSTRMGENKLLMEINYEPVLFHTLKALEASDFIKEIIISCRQCDMVEFSRISKSIDKPIKLVSGGDTRTHSTLNGIKEATGDFIGIHDGARPLVTKQLIDDAINLAFTKKCVVPVVPSKDTIKIVKDDMCEHTPDRNTLFSAQTPQVFKADIIRECTEKTVSLGLTHTDDGACVEHFGHTVYVSSGDYENIKITTHDDILLANLILERRL